MNDVPPSQEPSDDDIDTLYRRVSALDPSRPSAGVSRAILAHAALVARERVPPGDSGSTNASRARTRRNWWRPAVFGTLAAAVLAGLFVLPNIRTSYFTPQTYPRVAQGVQSFAPATPRQPTAAASDAPPAPAPASPTPREQQSPSEALTSGAAGQLAEITTATEPAPKAKVRKNSSAGAAPAANGTPPAAAGAKGQQAPLVDITVTAQRQVGRETFSTPAPIAAVAAEPSDRLTSVAPPEILFSSPARLHLAAERGDLDTLQAALDHLTDINSRDDAGRTALLLATLHNQPKAVTLLLAHGADPNIADANGLTPLQAATRSGKSAIIKALKGAGAH